MPEDITPSTPEEREEWEAKRKKQRRNFEKRREKKKRKKEKETDYVRYLWLVETSRRPSSPVDITTLLKNLHLDILFTLPIGTEKKISYHMRSIKYGASEVKSLDLQTVMVDFIKYVDEEDIRTDVNWMENPDCWFHSIEMDVYVHDKCEEWDTPCYDNPAYFEFHISLAYKVDDKIDDDFIDADGLYVKWFKDRLENANITLEVDDFTGELWDCGSKNVEEWNKL